jgi:ornithine cyclodeaminase/alanine dehydrogenase-like protein (mu-crystallin family)
VTLPWLDAGELSVSAAADALEAALRDGFDPKGDPPRVASGEFLLMPSSVGPHAGVKVLSVARGNAARGLPVIQGVFVLWDAETLAPVALVDGAALTLLRTPAVSLVAARRLAPDRALRLAVFGAGPQAQAHTAALKGGFDVSAVDVVRSAMPSAEVEVAVRRADVICCCTSARTPLFDGALVRDDALVIATGSHEPDARELDSALMGRATVVVESRTTAVREAGDVIQAVDEDALDAESLLTLADLVRSDTSPAPDRPRVFKSAGMSWEDVVVASALRDQTRRTGRG